MSANYCKVRVGYDPVLALAKQMQVTQELVHIPILVDPPHTLDLDKLQPTCQAMHHPETSASVKPLPFVWSIALLRFLSRMSLRIDKYTIGVSPRNISVYRLQSSELASLWTVVFSPIARKLLDILLTGSSHSVVSNDCGIHDTSVEWTRSTRSPAEMRMSVDNVVVLAIEEASGAKITRGVKRLMWNRVEDIEIAMFTWTMNALRHTKSPMLCGWATIFVYVNVAKNIGSKNTAVVKAVERQWKQHTRLQRNVASCQHASRNECCSSIATDRATNDSNEVAPSSNESVSECSPPFLERACAQVVHQVGHSRPMLSILHTTSSGIKSPVLLEEMISKVLVDEVVLSLDQIKHIKAVAPEELICDKTELTCSNELLVQSVMRTPGNTIGSISWPSSSIVPRLDLERRMWGLTRSLLI